MSDTLNICGLTVERGQKLRTFLPVPDTNVKIPLTIINGCEDGPTLLITAGIHGGEYPGIAAAMELGLPLVIIDRPPVQYDNIAYTFDDILDFIAVQ